MMNTQQSLRKRYADRRRNSIHRSTARVQWKTRSKIVV